MAVKLIPLLDHINQKRRRSILTLLLLAALALGLPPTAVAQTYALYSAFEELTDDELKRVQVKITHLVPIRRLMPSTILTASPPTVDISLFRQFRQEGHDYMNDEFTDFDGTLEPHVIEVSTLELRSLVESIEDLPATDDDSPQQWASHSLALLYADNDTVFCFERIYDRGPARGLLTRLRAVFSKNRIARITLASMACHRNLNEDTIGEDVTSHVIIKVSDLRFYADLDPPRYVGTVTVTNATWRMLLAPVSVVLKAEGGVHLMDAYDYTCKVFPMSGPYVNLPVGQGLASGESASVVVWFASPDGNYPKLRWNNGAVDIAPVVIAGRGER